MAENRFATFPQRRKKAVYTEVFLNSVPTRGVSFFDTKIGITQRNLYKNLKYFNNWTVAQAGLNDEKNWRSKISLDCCFKMNFPFFHDRIHLDPDKRAKNVHVWYQFCRDLLISPKKICGRFSIFPLISTTKIDGKSRIMTIKIVNLWTVSITSHIYGNGVPPLR